MTCEAMLEGQPCTDSIVDSIGKPTIMAKAAESDGVKKEESIASGSTCSGGSSKTDGTPETPASRQALLEFHHSNIHEGRIAAYVARAVPFSLLVITTVLSILGLFWKPMLLLWICAVFNPWMWVWLVSYALFSLQSTWKSRRVVAAARVANEAIGDQPTIADVEAAKVHHADAGCASDVVHLVILPNYKEDVSIMTSTLTALGEAKGSSLFRIVLAMEAREGSQAKERAEQLQERFAHKFAHFSVALHPLGLTEEHLDGGSVPEVPGKSSNLKWAVRQAFEECLSDGVDMSRVVLTAADADCIFHPDYFVQVGSEFATLRLASPGEQCWAMWQSPQLPFRNYSASPAPSRLWGYVASIFEIGGVGGLQFGGYHMTFSSFSLPLSLAMAAAPWDGDVIADDHHCYLKCFLYSIYHGASQEGKDGKWVNPPLQLRPVMLPTKSTSVEAENCVKSWKARFNQAKRHTQGVAEFSYILLSAWRLMCTLPFSAYSFSLIWKLVRAILLPFCVDMLPIIQSIPFAVESLYWFYHGMGVPECPNNALYKFDDPQFYFCWFAGGFNLAWPMILPIGLVIVASYFMVAASFIEPSDKDKQDKQKLEGSTSEVEGSGAIWHNEDGDVHATCGSKRLTVLGYVLFDVVVMLPIVMPIFGVIPAVMAYWNTLVRGNRFNFVSAAKGVATQPVVAVTMTSRLEQERNVGAAIVGQTHQGDQGDQNMV